MIELLFYNVKLIISFLTERKIRVSVEGQISALRYMQVWVSQRSVSHTVQLVHK
jgi:hypothetical protein